MIIITGAAGFIGSNLVSKLNAEGYFDLILVDDFTNELKKKNLEGKKYSDKIHRDEFINWTSQYHRFIQFIFHLGARTDTAEFDRKVFDKLNLNYSKDVWKNCCEYGLPLVYASSAATYGSGEYGYSDDHEILDKLSPLNPYGESKNDFDKWAVNQKNKPYFWAGLKFFNVYGPNEYHKNRMASVVFHTFNQIKSTDKMQLFRSHHPDYKDGEQKRDFIYVKDVTEAMYFFLHHRKNAGIYNLGTGKARNFNDLVKITFSAMNVKPVIEYTETPEDIRDKYQYFTQAEMNKLKSIQYNHPFTSLESGIEDYVLNYLQVGKYN
ncbi:ADP-glyceromanno-heptose 6-epimerase [Bacteroidota bacterium]